MAALKKVEILLKNLKSYNQLPDNLVSQPCTTEYSGNKKIKEFFSFTVILDPLQVDTAEVSGVLHARAYALGSLCGFHAFISI